MEEQREEGEFIGDCRDDMDEAGTGLGLSSKNETLAGEVDVPQEEPKDGDSDVSETKKKPNDGEIDKSGERGSATGDGSLKEGDGKDDVVSSEDNEVVDNRDGAEKTVSSDDIETTDAITEPISESYKEECDIDAETVDAETKKTVVKPTEEKEGSELCNEAEMIDETAMPETKRKNDASQIIAGGKVSVTSGNEGTDVVKANNSGDCDGEQNVQTDVEMVSAGKNKADQEKEPAQDSEEGNNKQEKEEKSYADQEKESAKKSEEDNNKIDVDSKRAKEEKVGFNEEGNTESETFDEKDSDSVQVPEQPDQLSKGETVEGNPGTVSEVNSAAEICGEGQIIDNNQEETEDTMEIDSTTAEHVEVAVKVGDNESADVGMVQSEDVQIAESDSHVSDVAKEMEIDEQKDDGTASDLTGKIESTDSANRNNLTDNAATGEVEPLDHNALFDPSSDITNFIDFSGVSSWPGNKVTDMAEHVAPGDSKQALEFVPIQGSDCKNTTVNTVSTDSREVGHSETQRLNAEGIENESNEACAGCETGSPAVTTDHPKEASDTFLGSEENQEDKDQDQEGTLREQEDNHEAPSIDPNQKQDTEMEENPNDADYPDDGTDTDLKTNGVKRKADVLGEDSPREGRKTVSLAKVSFTQKSSFKIGECIARAASQMTESPSLLKGRNLSDENLSVETSVSQLFSAATNPVKANVISEIGASFFLDHRNSVVPPQAILEEVFSKIGRVSNSDTVGTKAFEFEETGDTYWNDRVIHNGGEEQTPPAEKRNYQVVPVELKPAQVQRTRRPYRRRQTQIINPNLAADKPSFDENAPAELVMNFSETDTIPAEKRLSNMFRHFGPIKETQTEVDRENNRARVVFRKGADAETAYNSLGRINIFGTKVVNYELNFTISETFKVEPYVVSLGDVDAALCPPS